MVRRARAERRVRGDRRRGELAGARPLWIEQARADHLILARQRGLRRHQVHAEVRGEGRGVQRHAQGRRT